MTEALIKFLRQLPKRDGWSSVLRVSVYPEPWPAGPGSWMAVCVEHHFFGEPTVTVVHRLEI